MNLLSFYSRQRFRSMISPWAVPSRCRPMRTLGGLLLALSVCVSATAAADLIEPPSGEHRGVAVTTDGAVHVLVTFGGEWAKEERVLARTQIERVPAATIRFEPFTFSVPAGV